MTPLMKEHISVESHIFPQTSNKGMGFSIFKSASDTESIADQYDPPTTDRKGNKIVPAVILLQYVLVMQDRVQKRSESYLLWKVTVDDLLLCLFQHKGAGPERNSMLYIFTAYYFWAGKQSGHKLSKIPIHISQT